MIDSIETEVQMIVGKIVGASVESVTSTSHLINDLHADSMLILEIMVAIEKKFKIEIPENKMRSITTIESLVNLIKKSLNGQII